MNYLIKQPAGIGDIFFLQKAAYILTELKEHTIIWPIIDEFLWIKDYLKYSPFIEFIPLSSNFQYKDEYLKLDPTPRQIGNTIIIPFQHADWLFPGISVMDAKYKMIDLDFEDYIKYFEFKRNEEKEDQLYYDLFRNYPLNTPYILVNRWFASPPNIQECKYIPENFGDKRVIEININSKYTMFDWCYLIENADEIHFVETSFNYIIEKLKPKGKMFMYSKHNPPSYNQVQHLFKQNWTYVY